MSTSLEFDQCKVCAYDAQEITRRGDQPRFRCPRCGEYSIHGSAARTVDKWTIERRYHLSAWIRRQNILGDHPEIGVEDLDHAVSPPPLGFAELADRLLLYALRREGWRGAAIPYDDPAFEAVAYTTDCRELKPFWRYLEERNFIERDEDGEDFKIRPAGYIHCDQLQANQVASSQGFVAMWFDPSMGDVWRNGFEPAIQGLGMIRWGWTALSTVARWMIGSSPRYAGPGSRLRISPATAAGSTSRPDSRWD